MTVTKAAKKTAIKREAVRNERDIRREADRDLIRAARLKIIRAQDRGTLSASMSLSLYPTQIVVGSPTDKDVEWLKRHFGGEETKEPGRWITKRKQRVDVGGGYFVERGRPKPYDTYRWEAPLRDPADQPEHYWGSVPKVEIHSLLRPHECMEWVATAKRDAAERRVVKWTCRACGRPITKTKAKEMGLVAA